MNSTATPSVQPQPPGIDSLVRDAVLKTVTPEYINDKVQEHVDKLVEDGLREALSSYSPMGKSIKDAIGEALQVGDRLNIPSYGHVVGQMLERQLQARVSDVVAGKLAADMEKLLKLAPKRVKLSDLVAELLEGDDGLGEVHCEVEWGEWSSAYLVISKEKPTRHSDADIRVLITLPKKHHEYESSEVPEGPICSGHVNGSDLQKDVRFGYGADHPRSRTRFGQWFGFEQKFLAMYACGTVIELDEDCVVTSRYDY